jgi:multidrug efflux system membrane fusion protein
MRLLPATFRLHLLAVAGIAALASTLASCGKAPAGKPNGAMPPPPVGVATPIAKTLPQTRELTGRLEAVQSVDLRSRVGGTILQVLVADGAEVQAGEVLMRIDDEPLKATLTRIEAERTGAAARLAQAQQQFERSKDLVATKIVSQQSYDDAESTLNVAKAVLAAADAALVNAKLDLSHAIITAPITGRIGRVQATVGNVVQASGQAPGTLLATLVSYDPVYAAFDLDETTWQSLAPRLTASAKARGQGDAAVPVGVALPGEHGFPHLGTVSFVDNQIDSASGSIRIRATLPNSAHVLTPGAFARIQLQVAAPRPVLLINERAVQAQLLTRYVLVVDSQGMTSFRAVQLGENAEGLRVVLGGLAPTDTIAVNNLAKIFYPGMPVTPIPASMITLINDAPPTLVAAPAAIEGK